MSKESPILKYKETLIFIAIVAALFAAFFLITRNPDISFAKRCLENLSAGRESVQDLVDWEAFKGMGVDVGTTYKALASEQERNDFRRVFIKSFSNAFKNIGGKLGAFTNWRVYDKDVSSATIAVDNTVYKKTLIFTISYQPRKKLVSAQWEEAKP